MPLRFNYEPQETRANLIAPSLYTSYKPTALPTVGDVMYKNMDVKKVEPTTEGVTGRIYTPSLASVVPTLDSVIRKINLPSYIPSDTPKGLISRDDWDNFDDVNFYVGTDGKYHSTEPFFERLFWRESKNDLNALSKDGRHVGPAQFNEDTWRRVMPGVDVSYRTNPEYAGKATANYARINAKTLRKASVPINTATIYGAHNLGAGTIINMYKDLDAPLLGQDLKYVLSNFNDAKQHAPELYKKYIRDPNSLTGRDYMNLINAIFTN